MSSIYNTLVAIENRYDFDAIQTWFRQYWTVSIYACVFYAVTIFALKQWMGGKPEGYDVRRWLFPWSTGLAVFSVMGCTINGIRLWSHVYNYGLGSTLCVSRDGGVIQLAVNRYGVWTWCFVLSKIIELGDTYFIILKKQRLIFLHWYHHITVLLYTWYAYNDFTAVNQWFLWMNYAVHSIMYAYYSVRASGYYRPPIWINMFITVFQILQMILGVALNFYVYVNHGDPNWDCKSNSDRGLHLCYVSFAMYFSYFLLFVHFFVDTYVFKRRMSKKPQLIENSKVLTNGQVKCD